MQLIELAIGFVLLRTVKLWSEKLKFILIITQPQPRPTFVLSTLADINGPIPRTTEMIININGLRLPRDPYQS